MYRWTASVCFGSLSFEISGEISMKHIEDRELEDEVTDRLKDAFPQADFIHIELKE